MQKTTNNALTLILPQLLSHVKKNSSMDWKYLSMILARSQCHDLRLSAKDYALQLFGLPDASAAAALNLLNAGYTLEDKFACFAEPANIQPNRDFLYVTTTDFSDLTTQEIAALIEELNTYFAEDGFQFQALTPQRWVCILPEKMNLPTVFTRDIISENILPHMPDTPDNFRFKKFLSDVQMVLHHSKTNQQRNQQGKVEVNSLWLSGAGCLPREVKTNLTCVYTDNIEVMALSQLAGIDLRSANEFSMLKKNFTEESCLFLDLQADFQISVNPAVFQTIFEAVRNKTLHEVKLIINEEQFFLFNYSASKRFWKRKFRF